MQDNPVPKKRDYSGRVYKPRQCEDCPAVYVPRTSGQKRCPDCQLKNDRKMSREHMRRVSESQPRKSWNCVDCGAELPQPKGRPRLRCEPCREIHNKAQDRERNKKWSENPGRKAYDAEWRKNNPDAGRVANRKYRLAHPEKWQKDRLGAYGLTIEQFDAMLAEQGGGCALCGKVPDPNGKKQSATLHVDHDHETGKVRALLCLQCNSGLGSLCDDPALLRKAADYIEYHAKQAAEAGESGDDGLLF